MILMLLTLIANVLILIAFKLFPRLKVNNLNAIIINYFVAVITGSVLLGKIPFNQSTFSETWFPYAVFLSLVFIVAFNVMALTIQKTGVVIGTLFQKMSLLFPVAAAMLFFGEDIFAKRIIGIVLTVISIIVINLPSKGEGISSGIRKYWYLPLLTLLFSGIIEFLLYYVDVKSIVPNGDISFVTFLFFGAGTIGIILKILMGKWNVSKTDLIAGIGLGIPNFFSIYLLLKSLSEGIDASVMFPFINLGTILFGVLLGYFAFKEEMGRNKTIGVFLAIIAIYLIVS